MTNDVNGLPVLLKKCRWSLIAVVIFSACINILMLTVPIYMLQLINSVIPNRSMDTLILLTGIVIAGLLVLALLEIIRDQVLVQIGFWLHQRLAADILEMSILRSLRRGRRHSVQGLRDVSTLRGFLTGSGLVPLLDLPWTPIFLGVVFLLHPLIGMITLVGAVALFALAVTNEFATRGILAQANDAADDTMDSAHAVTRNADVIHAMGMSGDVAYRWDGRNDDALQLKRAAQARSARIMGVTKFARMVLQVSVLGTAAYLAMVGQITVGAMIASVLLMRRAVAPIERSITSWKTVVSARRAYRRINSRLGDAARIERRVPLWEPTGKVRVRDLRYAPESSSKSILKRVSFDLEPGEVLGVVGRSGTGKSTLAALLLGIVAPSAGSVKLDDVDIHVWDRQHLGPYVGFLPQNVELFSGTVRENIARMTEGDSDAVVRAAKLAGIHDMIIAMPNGYDTEIGDSGAILSGGQKQRIGLARAIYGQPKLLVLDEPDANLDREGQAALVQTIKKLKEAGTTIVLITHRTEILQHADRTLMLARGRADIRSGEEHRKPRAADAERDSLYG